MNPLTRLHIRSRILLGILVPLLVTAGALAWMNTADTQKAGDIEMKRLEASLLESRKTGLKNLVDSAGALVVDAKNNPDLSEAKGDGFHGYEWPNPASGGVKSKVSFTTIIPDWGWMIGTGVYITDVDAVLAQARADIDAEVASALDSMLPIAAVVVAVALKSPLVTSI